MPHSYTSNFVHCVFSTKERRNIIPAELQERLWAYLFGIAKNLKVEVLVVGGTANHIHMLIGLPATMPLAEAVQKLKANSSRWLAEQSAGFGWQRGYGAFSVSSSLVDTVKRYVRNQAEHHKRRSFEEEFLVLLRKSGISVSAKEVL